MRTLNQRYRHSLSYWQIMMIGVASLAVIGPALADTVVNSYDALNRITKIQYDNGMVVEYSYDKAGNRTQRIVTDINQAPIANAGGNQNVVPGVQVTLNGTASNDPDNFPAPLTFAWTQISGPTVTLTNAATATPGFTPTQSGTYLFQLVVSDGRASSPQSTITVQVGNTNQTISFGAAPTVSVGETGTLSATGGASGNPVTFTSTTTGICTVSGNTVTGVNAGSCTIAANQAGNANYNAAPQTTQSFSIGQPALQSQTISFGAAPTVSVGETGTVSATGGASGNPVTFASTTTGICTVSGNTVTGVNAGSCIIAANQAGNANYNAAPQATQIVAISQGTQMNSSAECLFNWAENNYPSIFAPTGAPMVVWSMYTYRHYSATNAYLGVSSIDNHVYYMGPDGVLQDEGPLADWLPKAGCGSPPALPPSDCLFNWAEQNYPGLFAPAGSSSAAWSVYTYRYYSGTNAYLGVSSTDNHVYYMGQDGKMQDEGAMSKWLPLAGCQ